MLLIKYIKKRQVYSGSIKTGLKKRHLRKKSD